MNCDLERVEALFEDTLPPQERSEVEEHLAHCPQCRAWYEALTELRADIPAPTGFDEAVMRQVHATAQVPARRRSSRRRWQGLIAAAACIALVVGFSWFQGRPDDGALAREADEAVPYDLTEGEELAWLEACDREAPDSAAAHWRSAGGDMTQNFDAEETRLLRTWLDEAGHRPELTGENGRGYCLREAELKSLYEAAPSFGLPDSGCVQVYLPN